jgi:toxin ParE1/3/4
MLPKPVEFHPEAVEESEAALRWYRERSERAARAFLREIERAVAAISQTPNQWPSGAAGTRRVLLKRFPFAVVYQEQPASIQVIAVAHGRRRPGYYKKRFA